LAPINLKLIFLSISVTSTDERRQGLNNALKLLSASSSFFSIIFPTQKYYFLDTFPSLNVFSSTGPPISGTLWVRMTGGEGHRGVQDELGTRFTVAPNTGELNIGDESDCEKHE
jgi:hypothetical protein